MLDPSGVKLMKHLLVPMFLLLAAFGGQAHGQTTNPGEAGPLPAPQQKAPADNAQVMDAANHVARLEWAPVAGAATYGIEIDCLGCCEKHRWCSDENRGTQVEWMVKSPYLFRLPAGRPGSWRVWAVDQTGQMGKASDWLVFGIAGGKDSPSLPPQTHAPPQKLPLPMVLRVARPVDAVTGEPCAWPQNPPPKEVTPPKAIYTPDPEYSDSARKARINGQARVALEVGADGKVKRACVLEAVQPDLGEQAVIAIRRWRFQPAVKNGRPVSFETFAEISFNIDPWRQN